MIRPSKIAALARRLRADRSGLALMEFAFTMPLLMTAGMYSVEVANLALINLRVSQIALNLADNAARVGNTPLTTQQLREIDISDILQAVRYQGASIDLTTRGRVVLTSLENVTRTYADGTSDAAPVQRMHWQRCIGKMGQTDATYRSSYGDATPFTTAGADTTQGNAGVTKTAGMGDAGAVVNAPTSSGVMFVEINYNYKPLLSGLFIGDQRRIHYVASFIVRDNRDFAYIYNPLPAVADADKMTCDRYTT